MIDKEFFCREIRLCEKSMYTVAFSVVQNETDAAEVLSEAIYRAYKNLRLLKKEESFKPWILKIVHNTAVAYVRKNARFLLTEEIEIEEEQDALSPEAKMSLREAVTTLKQPYQTVVILYYYEELSIKEISKITGATEMTVKKRLSRAREYLRRMLKEDFPNE